jgi:hypothetical protein
MLSESLWGAYACSVLAMAFCHRELFLSMDRRCRSALTRIRKSGGTLGGFWALVLCIIGIPLLVSMIQSDRERLQRLSTERKEVASDDGKLA